MNITFTDKCPDRLGRGPKNGTLFTKPGDTYDVPENFAYGEEDQLKFWLSEGWAVETDSKPKRTIRKGAKGTGPVTKSEVDAPSKE